MNILVITDGLEPLLHLTVVGLADRGHQVRVVGARSPGELDPVDRFRLGPSVRVSGGEGGGLLRRTGRGLSGIGRSAAVDVGALRAVASVTARTHGRGELFRRHMSWYLPVLGERPDVVYIEAANVAARFGPTLDHLGPKVVMCTGSDVRILPYIHPRWARVLPPVFARTARVLCRSEDLRQWALRSGAPVERTEVLYPAVDTRYFAARDRPPRDTQRLRLVSVGRHHWVKGYEYAVQAVAMARSQGCDVTYTIVGGDQGAADAVRYAAHELGLAEVVTLAGAKPVPGVRAALARADVFLVSSVGEGVSRAALEAMAMGLPVVTTDAGGMPEVVADGVEGLIVPRRDPRALADAIVRLADDAPLRAAMRERALARSRDFDADDHLDRLEKVLLDLGQR